MTAIQTGIEDTVSCPPWCKISQREHLKGLQAFDGRCVHWSDERHGPGWKIWHSSVTFTDGTRTDDQPLVYVSTSDGMTRPEAEALALALLAAYEEAGS